MFVEYSRFVQVHPGVILLAQALMLAHAVHTPSTWSQRRLGYPAQRPQERSLRPSVLLPLQNLNDEVYVQSSMIYITELTSDTAQMGCMAARTVLALTSGDVVETHRDCRHANNVHEFSWSAFSL